MGVTRHRWTTSLVIGIVRSPLVRRHPGFGHVLLETLDIDRTRSLGRLETVVAQLCIGTYRREWLNASRRLLALAGRARRGELGARMIARSLASASFLFDANDGERASIVQLLAAIGIDRVVPHLRDPAQARAFGTFLAIADGNDAARLFSDLVDARPFTAEDRKRMSHKLLVRLNHAIVDRSDVLRFAVRVARRFSDMEVAERIAAALAISSEDRNVLATTLSPPDGEDVIVAAPAASAFAGS